MIHRMVGAFGTQQCKYINISRQSSPGWLLRVPDVVGTMATSVKRAFVYTTRFLV